VSDKPKTDIEAEVEAAFNKALAIAKSNSGGRDEGNNGDRYTDNDQSDDDRATGDKTKLRERLRKLFAMLGSPNVHERSVALDKLHKLLDEADISWNTFMEMVGGGDDADRLADQLAALLSGAAADFLFHLAKSKAKLFRTPDGRTFADVVVTGHRETYPVRTSGFKRWLRHRYWQARKKVPPAEALDSAIAQLEAEAHYGNAPVRDIFIRVAADGEKIYLDLCDDKWTVIEIDTTGWRVAGDDPPVRFCRMQGMGPLPMPQRGGSINDLQALTNIAVDDFILIVSWLLAALRGKPPYPILALAGPPGSAKSTLAKFLRNLIDPNDVDPGALPREPGNRDRCNKTVYPGFR
jgi:ABC-type multidrug transport system fused ATPase/permease subunit